MLFHSHLICPKGICSPAIILLRVSLKLSRNFLSKDSATISAAFPCGLLMIGTTPGNMYEAIYKYIYKKLNTLHVCISVR